LSLDPGGDWTTQAADHLALLESLGNNFKILQQMADAGDRAAQFSLGYILVHDAGADDADDAEVSVGLAL
jgi:hypothetical protein